MDFREWIAQNHPEAAAAFARPEAQQFVDLVSRLAKAQQTYAGRALRADGRVKPREGDRVTMSVRGFMGEATTMGGDVVRKGSRLRVTNIAGGLIPMSMKDQPCDDRWTVVDDPAVLRARMNREAAAWRAEMEREATALAEEARRAAELREAQARHGSLGPLTETEMRERLRNGDVVRLLTFEGQPVGVVSGISSESPIFGVNYRTDEASSEWIDVGVSMRDDAESLAPVDPQTADRTRRAYVDYLIAYGTPSDPTDAADRRNTYRWFLERMGEMTNPFTGREEYEVLFERPDLPQRPPEPVDLLVRFLRARDPEVPLRLGGTWDPIHKYEIRAWPRDLTTPPLNPITAREAGRGPIVVTIKPGYKLRDNTNSNMAALFVVGAEVRLYACDSSGDPRPEDGRLLGSASADAL